MELGVRGITHILRLEFGVLSALQEREKFFESFWPNFREIFFDQKHVNQCIFDLVVALGEHDLVMVSQQQHVSLVHRNSLLLALHYLAIKVIEYVNDGLQNPKPRWLARRLDKELEEAD